MESSYIKTSGGIITSSFINEIFNDENNSEYLLPETYKIHENERIDRTILENNMLTAYELLCPSWDSIANEIIRGVNIIRLRSKWIYPLLQLFDYNQIMLKEHVIAGEDLAFYISHKGWEGEGAPYIHVVNADQELDKADRRQRYGNKSPHDYMQSFLNTSSEKWGIVTNGVKLRILRKHHFVHTKGYVEFDIGAIFNSRDFREFKVMYKLLHRSRFVKDSEGYCPLERIYEYCLASGTRIGFGLQKNVKEAIEVLGNGFLQGEIITKLQNSEDLCSKFYRELLVVVYRVLFLLFAEQRGLMPGRTSLYIDEYSITALKRIVERGIPKRDDDTDVWEGLKVTFRMISEGAEELDLYSYNGMLFDTNKTSLLNILACQNKEILTSIKHLTMFEEEGMLKWINYVDIGVEELGSIYESLLEFSPRVAKSPERLETEIFGSTEEIVIPANTFFLDPRGSARKQTGSYYTRRELVQELIKSALIPVTQEKLSRAKTKEDKVRALLSIKVCDPASGSGHFLIAANNYLGVELAKLRCGNDYPSEQDIRIAKRDVLINCIYGVDINPLAVELTKVALWINACVKGYPLNFLDHHVKCGNSLVGASPELIEEGILTETFEQIEDDDRVIANLVRKKNRREREELAGQRYIEEFIREDSNTYLVLFDSQENTPEEVHFKMESYNRWRNSEWFKKEKLLHDMWTASFYAELNEENKDIIPTYKTLELAKQDIRYISKKTIELVERLAVDFKFFHWQLEFPEVFNRAEKGFDCILGNPPWEAVVLKEKEYFIFRDLEIFNAQTKAIRDKMIRSLKYTNRELYDSFHKARRDIKCTSHFIRKSGKYRLSAVGTINTYSIFTDLAAQLVARKGRAGIIIQTGIATNEGTKDLFGYLVDSKRLISLLDFENSERLFPIHRSIRFCLFTLGGVNINFKTAKLLCYATNLKHLQEDERYFTMSPEEFKLVNPESKTMPSCRNETDKEILVKIYRNSKTLRQAYDNIAIRNMFHMSSDSQLFKTEIQLLTEGYKPDENWIYSKDGAEYMPLYEGKLFHQYIFNYNTYDGIPDEKLNGQNTNEISNSYKIETIKPRFWVNQNNLLHYFNSINHDKDWFFALRDITGATSERTTICTIIPAYPCGNTINIITNIKPKQAITIMFCLNSFVQDFASRLKVGGTHLNMWILEQLPLLDENTIYNSTYYKTIERNIIKLTYYHELLRPFAEDLGYYGDPFPYNEEERFQMQCELDAIAAKLYRINHEELDYILDTFPIVKRKDEDRYGFFRTKKVILEYFEKL